MCIRDSLGGLTDFLLFLAGLDGILDQGVNAYAVGEAQNVGGLQRDVDGVDDAAAQDVYKRQVLQAVEEGVISPQRIDESVLRILELKLALGILPRE